MQPLVPSAPGRFRGTSAKGHRWLLSLHGRYRWEEMILRTRTPFAVAAVAPLTLALTATVALADSVGPITFEPSQGYVPGDINGQQGWMKTGPYDVAVASVSGFPAASGYGFGTQALRLSDAVTSGSFGDQTFSPGLAEPGREAPGLKKHFDSTFWFGSALATYQPGMHMSVSPDNGSGARMSYLRFEDQTDGVHVFFDDVTDPGPFGTVATSSRPTSPRSAARAPIRSGSRSTSRPARATTRSRSTSTARRRSPARPGRTTTATTPRQRGTATRSRRSARCCSARAALRTRSIPKVTWSTACLWSQAAMTTTVTTVTTMTTAVITMVATTTTTDRVLILAQVDAC